MAEAISVDVGKVIARLRRERGWTQEDLAERAGITTTYYGMVERGESNVTLAAAVKIAHALEMQLSAILAEIGE